MACDAHEMWQHFEATCSRMELAIEKGPRGFGIELANNYVADIAPWSTLQGTLQV